MTRETSGSARGWCQVLLVVLLIAVLAPLAVAAQSGPITMEVYPSSAPNAYGSPSYADWVAHAVYALENNLATYGDSSLPTYYQRITVMTDRDNIVTGFPSWKGYADPGTLFGAAFASELGNRATYGFHALGNGTKIRLSNMLWNMHSSDPTNSLRYTGSFATATYEGLGGRALGIDYGADGIKGTGDDVRITTGSATQLVDEIVFAGRGNAYDAYCPGCTTAQQQAAIDATRAQYTAIMPFDQTTEYILYDDSHNILASGSGTTYYGSTSNPPNLSLTKLHVGNMIQGDPGTAAGTLTVGPVANVTGASGTSAPGFGPGAWQAGGTAKAEVYLTPAQLFGHPVTVADIASISWWTNKASGPQDWYALIYTVPQGAGDTGTWFRSRLNSEPYLSGGTFTPDAWAPWSSSDATHPLRFYDALRNGGVYGTYTDPLLSAITGGAVTWPTSGTTWDYSGEQVLSLSVQTGSGWASGFTGLLDGFTVTLSTGEVATVNFEAYTNTYFITVSNATASSGAGPTDGTTVTVTDTLPPGLTATAFCGLGWITDLSDPSHPVATRTDVLGPGQSYPPLILKVVVDPTTSPSVTNHATVTWGGGSGTFTASDPTTVQQIPTHLAFTTQPSSASPGAALSPAVEVAVQDAGNQVVTDYTGSVTLALSGGTAGAVLSGGGATATVSGAATFPDLSVDLMGLGYTLGASAPYGSGALAGTSTSFDIRNPTPALTSLSPFNLAPGQPAFTLTANGSGFVSGATVYFNGVAMTTAYASPNQLTAAIPAASVASVGSYAVVVRNPPVVLADSNPLTFTVARPSLVYVDDDWAVLLPGACPDGSHYIGYDAFAVIQNGVDAVADAGTVNVAAGTYLAEVVVGRAMLLHGAGTDISTIIGPKTGGANTLTIGATGVTVEGFTITRDGNNVADWNLPTLKSQGVIFNQGVSGSTLRYCKLTGNRNAVYINNAQGNTVRNNIIDFNRTGIHFNNNVTGTVVTQNDITNSWTMGILFNQNTPALVTTGVVVTNNKIEGNWYGEIQCRWPNGTAILDLSGNWLGTSNPTTSVFNSGEPPYASVPAAVPVAYGGTGANPGGSPTVGGVSSTRVDYTPWLNSGTDTDSGTIGFQGDFSYLNVGAASPQSGSLGRIAEGTGLVTTGGTVNLTSGTYTENVTVGKALSLLGPNTGKTGWDGTRGAEALLLPATVGPYVMDPDHSTTILRITSPDVTVDGLAFDGHNPALTGGVTMGGVEVHAACGISNWADDHDAAGALAPSLTLKENTFTHFGYCAIDLDGGAAPQAGTLVRDNYFTGIDPGDTPVYGWGVGVVLETNYYADVLNNHGDNIRKGAQTNNFYQANPGAAVSISGNDFGTWRAGLYHNLHYSGASSFTISGNTFRAEAGSTTNKGLILSSIQSAVGVTVQNNTVLGGFAGIEGWNLPTSAPLSIQGGSVTGAQYGILLWNNQNPGYGFSSGDVHLNVTGVTLNGCSSAGIRVFDDPANTNVPNGLFLTANAITATGCATGLLVDGANASAVVTAGAFTSGSNGVVAQNGGTVSATDGDLSGNASFGTNNLNGGGTPVLTATCNWWGTASGPTAVANPDGAGSAASPSVIFESWWTTPTGTCDGTVATHLAFSVQPSLSVAGQTMTPAVVVQALDASNSVAVGFGGTIALALSGGTAGAVLSGGTATAVNGVATFSGLSVSLGGSAYQLTASFTGLTPATSNPFDVWAVPTVVYANKAWAGLAGGSIVTANGGPHVIGYDAFAVIQDGLNAVAPAGTVYVYPTAVPTGGYAENLLVTKPLTLAKAPDAGASDVVLYPALSAPNPSGCAGSLCAGASNIILVQANDVTLRDLTLDGDNPSLTSGILSNGVDVDARNGIITNHLAGIYSNLAVSGCTVKNIFLRGIYASSTGSFNIHHNTVTNVWGGGSSIGIFAYGGPGIFANNQVSQCSDGVSANHSKGIQFLDNTVSDSGSGVHSDNTGDGGGVADLIKGNTVTRCDWGIWVFVPYIAPTVEDNTVTDSSVAGMAAAGGAFSGPTQTTIFRNNTVIGSSPVTATSVGFYLTDTTWYWGETDVSVSLQNNTFQQWGRGIQVETMSRATTLAGSANTLTANTVGFEILAPTSGGSPVVTFNQNSIYGNTTAGFANLSAPTASAACNWWGSATGPSPFGTGDNVSTAVAFVPWSTTVGPGYTCAGGAPVITGITDVDPCAQSGILVAYTTTPQATSHNLYRDGLPVVTGYTSCAVYNPGDTSSHSYVIRAILPAGTLDSASSSFADVDDTPVAATNVVVDNPDCTGARVTFTASPNALGYELWVDGTMKVTGFTSGGRYTPADGASHSYVVRAVRNTCFTDSTPVAYAVINLTPPRVTDSLMVTKSGNNMLLSWDLILPASVVDYYQVGRFIPQPSGPPVFETVIGTASGQVNGIQVSLNGEPANAMYLVRAVKGTCYGPWE